MPASNGQYAICCIFCNTVMLCHILYIDAHIDSDKGSNMIDEEAEAILHTAPLDADSVPNANQSHYCYSCAQPITGLHCAACGQKNDNMRRSIGALTWEVFSSLTALEGRMWRTWGALLFKPGKVAREFADGARTKWSSPVRVYLAMSLLLFGYLSVFNVSIFSMDVDVRPIAGLDAPIETLENNQLETIITPHFFEPKRYYDARMAQRNFAIVERKIRADGLNFNIELDSEDMPTDGTTEDTVIHPNPKTDVNSDVNSSEASSLDASDTTTQSEPYLHLFGSSFGPDTLKEFGIRFLRNPAIINNVFHTWLPRLMFLMMPITMLLGAIFIRGRGNALLYDHLVHASYVHAVTYLILFISIISSQFLPGNGVTDPLLIALIVYLPLSARRMFSRGWIKTIWASYGVAFIYLIIILIGLTLLIALKVETEIIAIAQ